MGSSLRSLRPVITTTESKSEELQEKHTYDTLQIPNYENNDIDDNSLSRAAGSNFEVVRLNMRA